MNTALRHWKEAATLVVAAGRRSGVTRRRGIEERPFGPTCGRQWPSSDEFDYEILVVKRSQGSGFMPNASVFPGGVVDSADFHHDWARLLAPWRKSPPPSGGVAADYGVTCGTGPRPPVFATDRGGLGSAIPGELAFRICAIRETFEESGVLIARPALPPHHAPGGAAALASAVRDSPVLQRWRELVRSDARLFAAMCAELHVVPDVWALHEWSNWLTPVPLARPAAGAAQPRRFDAVFFLCCLEEGPVASQDNHETVSAQWLCPPELMSQAEAGALWLAPPQRYETARLCRVPALLSLADFARRRAKLGLRRWMPVRIPDPAGTLIVVLPGDELYPAEADSGGDGIGGGDGHDGHGGNSPALSSAVMAPTPPPPADAVRRLHRATTVHGREVLLVTAMPDCGHLTPFTKDHTGEQETKTESGIESRL